MPTLNWIGKDAVVNHHKEVPFHLLKCNEKLSVSVQTSEIFETSEVWEEYRMDVAAILAKRCLDDTQR